jgi:opacity protein-like surface antigen
VTGVEADIQGSGIKASANAAPPRRRQTPGFSSVKLSLLKLKISLASSASVSKSKVGWTAGAGAEWMFAHNWSAKLEYLYVDLGSESAIGTLASTSPEITIEPGLSARYTWRFRENIAPVGMNYHFN